MSTKTCKNCGVGYTPTKGRETQQKYCSKACGIYARNNSPNHKAAVARWRQKNPELVRKMRRKADRKVRAVASTMQKLGLADLSASSNVERSRKERAAYRTARKLGLV